MRWLLGWLFAVAMVVLLALLAQFVWGCARPFNPRMSERCVQNLDFCMDRLHRRCPEGWDTYTTSSHWGNPNGPDYSQTPTGDIVPGGYMLYGSTRPWYALERERADWMYYAVTVECLTRRTAELPTDRETGN